MAADRMLCATRAAVFSALCVVLAVSSHTATSGHAVSWWQLFVVFVGVWVGVLSFTERERGPVAVIGTSLTVQLLLHGALSLGHPTAAAHPAHHVPAATGGAHPAALESAAGGHPQGMLAGHLAMALLSAVWLWWGERALFTLLRWAAHRVLGPPPGPVRPPRPRPTGGVRPTVVRRPRSVLRARQLGSRGPPAGRAFQPTALRQGRARAA
ncbi:hypothetical protein RM844_06265 [Streptomyces sp. DSM 44915]|uniref:Integral membrane protein n=1 Tax=Streptomyces chisholmiae TaxID=3075540 RepID=A0ABU2JLN3_9ACTN|nr:hypothetical protein [Streptomyces sp. DSM 44915]MDT0265893.1 hypothetical protein [Streptomyces sp. DSM 44915]